MVHLFFPTFFFCIEVFLLLLERGINLVCAVFFLFFFLFFRQRSGTSGRQGKMFKAFTRL